MIKLLIKTTKPKEVVDITEKVNAVLTKDNSDCHLCHLFIAHTTAALTTADLDPGTDLDMLDAYEAMIPKLKFRHPHNPEHAPDHIWSSIIGTSLILPFNPVGLILGTWQRVVLIEFNGPKERELFISLIN